MIKSGERIRNFVGLIVSSLSEYGHHERFLLKKFPLIFVETVVLARLHLSNTTLFPYMHSLIENKRRVGRIGESYANPKT